MGYIALILLVFLMFYFVAIKRTSRHWRSDEYFHLMHVRNLKFKNVPCPDSDDWVGFMQHDYPLLFHRFLSIFPLNKIREIAPIVFEMLNGLLVLVFTYYISSSWKISLVALIVFLFNHATLTSLFFSPRSFSLLFFNLLFVLTWLYINEKLSLELYYMFCPVLICLVFLSYKFAYQIVVLWALFLVYYQKDFVLVTLLGFLLAVVFSNARMLKVLGNHFKILREFFRIYRKNRFLDIFKEPLVFCLVPLICMKDGLDSIVTGTAIYFVILGILNATSYLAFLGEPLKFFYFTKLPLSIIAAACLYSDYFLFVLMILILETVVLFSNFYLTKSRRLYSNVQMCAVQIRKLSNPVIVYGKPFYPLFYYCGDKVMRKRSIPKNTSLNGYFHLREKRDSSMVGNTAITSIYENDELIIYKMS